MGVGVGAMEEVCSLRLGPNIGLQPATDRVCLFNKMIPLHISPSLSRLEHVTLHHGSVGRVQTKYTTLCFHLLFFYFFVVFHYKFFDFIIFIPFF